MAKKLAGMPITNVPKYVAKTRLCRYFAAGHCRNGGACTFAHGLTEVASKADLYRTRICNHVLGGGTCPNPDCTFAHSAQELREVILLPSLNSATFEPTDIHRSPETGCIVGLSERAATRRPPTSPLDDGDGSVHSARPDAGLGPRGDEESLRSPRCYPHYLVDFAADLPPGLQPGKDLAPLDPARITLPTTLLSNGLLEALDGDGAATGRQLSGWEFLPPEPVEPTTPCPIREDPNYQWTRSPHIALGQHYQRLSI